MSEYRKPLPRPTPETAPFWEGTLAGELRLQRCLDCRHVYFYPRPFCPKCHSRSVEWFKASGRGRLHTYQIVHRAAMGFEQDAPYVLAVVELEEGPRMMTNIVGVDPKPENLPLDMPVEVTFDRVTDKVALPKFRPAQGGVK